MVRAPAIAARGPERSGPLVYYITPHGHGHAARSCDIARAFAGRHPDVPVVVVSEVDERFLRSRLAGGRFRFRRAAFDVGLVQRDSVLSDLPATLDALAGLAARRPGLLERERAFLRRVRARAAVADIPAIPIEAAAAEGVPALAVGNFSWNWIYERYADADGDPRWRDAAEAYAAGYARADLLLRLPFHEEMSAFPRREDVPVVAGPGRARRAEIAAALDGPAGATWVLLSFGTLAWPEAALRRLEALEDFVFLSVRPLEWRRRNFRAVDRNRFPFSDVLASADLVLTKPGFGIVSECVVNAKPVVCVERHDFAEAEVLAAALRRHARCVFVPQAALYAGDLADAFRLALVAPAPPEAVAAGGAQVAARRIAQLAGLE